MSCKVTSLKRSDILELEMDLNGICNLKCPLCTRNYKHAQHLIKPHTRTLEDIITQLESFPNLEIFYMTGAVSEPTLYKDLHKLCQYLVHRSIRIELFTNGNTNTPEWWRELGEILSPKDQVFFTICGSNQIFHSAYRVGSSLDEILLHHQAFKEGNPHGIDRIQHIMFDYNKSDFESSEMKDIISRFSGVKLVDTEGMRSINEHIKTYDKNLIRPERERERSIESLFKIRPRPDDGKSYEIQCMSLRDHKIYIDQFGKISPCYGHAEYEGTGYFSGEVFDYNEILEFSFHDCFKCEKRIQKFIEVMELDFVC